MASISNSVKRPDGKVMVWAGLDRFLRGSASSPGAGAELVGRLTQLRAQDPDLPVLVVTAFGDVSSAVSAMREGAYDFVEKPLKRMTIVKSVRKAAERQKPGQKHRR